MQDKQEMQPWHGTWLGRLSELWLGRIRVVERITNEPPPLPEPGAGFGLARIKPEGDCLFYDDRDTREVVYFVRDKPFWKFW